MPSSGDVRDDRACGTVDDFAVSTKVLIDQARACIEALEAQANAPLLADLDRQGLGTTEFIRALGDARNQTEEVEALQERLKQKYVAEAKEDRVLAEQGYRWILRLQAKARSYMVSADADAPEQVPDLSGTLRFGKLHSARARGVVYELRILIPEAVELVDELTPFGAGTAFIQEGKGILDALGIEQHEITEAKEERKRVTREVRKAERKLSQLLRRLVAADEAAALERPDAARHFTLDIVSAERGRIEAGRLLRVARRAADDPGPDVNDLD